MERQTSFNAFRICLSVMLFDSLFLLKALTCMSKGGIVLIVGFITRRTKQKWDVS